MTPEGISRTLKPRDMSRIAVTHLNLWTRLAEGIADQMLRDSARCGRRLGMPKDQMETVPKVVHQSASPHIRRAMSLDGRHNLRIGEFASDKQYPAHEVGPNFANLGDDLIGRKL